MWLNGMMNPCLPLAIGNLDDDPEYLTFCGEHPEGKTLLEESDDNVELFPAQPLNINNDKLANQISNSTDPFQESSSFSIDIYTESLQIEVQTKLTFSAYQHSPSLFAIKLRRKSIDLSLKSLFFDVETAFRHTYPSND